MSLLRFKQIMPAAPGWRVLFCVVDGDKPHFSTSDLIGWGLVEDDSEIYPLILAGSTAIALRDHVGELNDERERLGCRVLQPSEKITTELKAYLEGQVCEAIAERKYKAARGAR